MEVDNHSETVCINGDSTKTFKEVSAPTSSQIPPGEDISSSACLTEQAAEVQEIDLNPAIAADTAVDPVLPSLVRDLNSTPCEVDPVSSNKLSQNKSEEIKEKEEVFDDMVIVENGKVTLPVEGSAEVPDDGHPQESQKTETCATDIKQDESTVDEDTVMTTVVEVSAQEDSALQASKSSRDAGGDTAGDVDPDKDKDDGKDEAPDVEQSDDKPEGGQQTKHEKLAECSAELLPTPEPAESAEPEPVPEVVNTPADIVKEKDEVEEKSIVDVTDISEEEIQSLKGQKVIKKFGKKKYSGDVVSFDPETKWFKVVYEDGDEEDLELNEVKSILASAQSLPSSSKKRPHSEDDETPQKRSKKQKKSGTDSTSKKGSAVKSPRTPKAQGKAAKKTKSPAKAAKGTPSSKSPKKGKGTPKSGGKGSSSKKANAVQSAKTQTKEKTVSEFTKSPAKSEETPKPESATKRKTNEEDISGSISKQAKKEEATTTENFIGKSVKKDFDGTFYNGVVVKFDKKTNFYKVKYEDGDQEELELHELEPILVQCEETKL